MRRRSARSGRFVERFAAGTGPVAVDAERASGYRYSQRAYLVQLRREGSGSALVDPIACPDLGALGAAIIWLVTVCVRASTMKASSVVCSALGDGALADPGDHGRLTGDRRLRETMSAPCSGR